MGMSMREGDGRRRMLSYSWLICHGLGRVAIQLHIYVCAVFVPLIDTAILLCMAGRQRSATMSTKRAGASAVDGRIFIYTGYAIRQGRGNVGYPGTRTGAVARVHARLIVIL